MYPHETSDPTSCPDTRPQPHPWEASPLGPESLLRLGESAVPLFCSPALPMKETALIFLYLYRGLSVASAVVGVAFWCEAEWAGGQVSPQ